MNADFLEEIRKEFEKINAEKKTDLKFVFTLADIKKLIKAGWVESTAGHASSKVGQNVYYYSPKTIGETLYYQYYLFGTK